MATYSLPPGWESDYDGVAEKWFFVHRPSGATQFLFPKAGDELKPVEMAQPEPQPQVTTDVLAEKIDAMTISLDQQQRGQTPGPAPPITPQQAQAEPHYQSQNSGDWNQTAPLAAPAPVQPSRQPPVQGDYPKTVSTPSNVSPYPAPAPLNYQNPQQYVQQQGDPPQNGPVPYQQPHHVQGVLGQIPQQVPGQPAPFNNQPQVQAQNAGQQYVNSQYAQRPQANQVIRRKPGPNQQRVASGQETKPTSPGPQAPVYQVQQKNWQPQSPQTFPGPQGSVPIDRRQSGQFQPQQQTPQYQTQGLPTVQYQNIQQPQNQPAQNQRQGSVGSQHQPAQVISYQGQPAHVQGVQQQRIMTPQSQYQVQNGIQPSPQPAQPISQALPQQQNPNSQPQYAQAYHQPQQYQQTPQHMQQNPQVPHSQGPPNSGVSQPAPANFQIPTQSALPTDPGNPLVPRPLQSMQPQSQGPQDNRRFSNIPNSIPQSISTQSPTNTPSPNQANPYPPPALSSPQQGQPQHQAVQIPNQVIYQQPPPQGNISQQPLQYTQSQLQSPQPITPGNGPQGPHLYRAQSGPASSTFAQLVERDSVIQTPGSIQNRPVQYIQQPAGHPQYQGGPQSQFQQHPNMQTQPVNNYSPATQGQIMAPTGPSQFQMQTHQTNLTAHPTATQPQIGSSGGRPGLMSRWSTGGLASSKKALDKSKGWMKKNPLGTLAIAGGLGIVAEAAGVNVIKDAKMAGKIYNGVQHVRAQNAHPHAGQKQPGQQHPQQGMSEAAMQAAIQKGIQDGVAKAMLQQGGHAGIPQGQIHPGQVPQGYQYSGHPVVQQGQAYHPQQPGLVHHSQQPGQVHHVQQQQQGIPGTRQIPGQQHPTHTQHHQQQQHFNPLQQFQQFMTHQQHPHHNQHPQHHSNPQQQQAGFTNMMIIPDPTVMYTPDPSGSPTQSQPDFDTQSQGGNNSVGIVDNDNGSDGAPDFTGGDVGGGDGGLDFGGDFGGDSGGDSGGFDMSDALSDQDAAIF